MGRERDTRARALRATCQETTSRPPAAGDRACAQQKQMPRSEGPAVPQDLDEVPASLRPSASWGPKDVLSEHVVTSEQQWE